MTTNTDDAAIAPAVGASDASPSERHYAAWRLAVAADALDPAGKRVLNEWAAHGWTVKQRDTGTRFWLSATQKALRLNREKTIRAAAKASRSHLSGRD
jgi:hypothetical protein